jgi:hypothetical protein
MMEMAGLERCHWVKDLIYFYRDKTPYTCDRRLQIACKEIIRAKEPLKRIEI